MNADELVKEILSIVHTLNEQDISSLSEDTLSRLALKLASYKASLGEHVALSGKLERDAEAEYFRVRAEAYRSLRNEGKGSTDADELKRLGSQESFLAWNKAKHTKEVVYNLSKDCHDLIDGIKSRLITLHQERVESEL